MSSTSEQSTAPPADPAATTPEGSSEPPPSHDSPASDAPTQASPAPESSAPEQRDDAVPATVPSSASPWSVTPVVNVVGESSPEPVCDVDQIDPSEYPPRQFPVGLLRRQGFHVVVRRSVLNEVHRHGQSSLDVEVCGVLVGNVFRDESGAFLLIDGSIRGTHAASRNAQVTFTAETWTSIQSEMEANHPNRRIVGWYHTHPGFGIFLSDMDLFIHGNFFNLAWQVAMVYDPKSEEEGLFVWKGGKTERATMLVEEDVEHEIATPPTAAVTPELVGELAWQLTRFQKRLKKMQVLLVVAVVIAIAWPFVLYTALSARSTALRPARNTPETSAAAPQNTGTVAPAAAVVGTPDHGDPVTSTNAAGGDKPLIVPATLPAPTTAAVIAVTPPTTPPADPVVATPPTPAPATQPVRTEPEIIRGNSSSHGPKVIETQPEVTGPGSPR